MLGYLMQLIVSFLLNVLIHKPKKRIKTPPGKVNSGQGEASVDALCRSTAEMLERRNLAGLMLDDFSFSQKLRKSDISSPALEDKLRAMALEVTGRLGLPPLKQVIVVRIDDVQQPDRFGEYDPGSRIIRFFIKKKYFPEQLEAALCHECAHYFMDLKGLADLSNMALNERRTDVTACLVGFSRIMIRGYMLLTKAHYRVVAWTTDSTRVGYLDAADCEQVRKYLLGIRPQLQSRQNAAADEAALRTQLTHNVAGAKAVVIDQFGTISPLQRASGEIWEGAIDLGRGFKYFFLKIDGADVLCPYLPIGYGCCRPMNFVDVPVPGETAWDDLDGIPHGAVARRYYPSKVSG